MSYGYQGFGATAPLKFNFGPEYTACMQAQLASHKAGGPYNPQACLSTIPKGGGGVPTIAWVGLGVLLVGGGAALYWFKFRKHTP